MYFQYDLGKKVCTKSRKLGSEIQNYHAQGTTAPCNPRQVALPPGPLFPAAGSAPDFNDAVKVEHRTKGHQPTLHQSVNFPRWEFGFNNSSIFSRCQDVIQAKGKFCYSSEIYHAIKLVNRRKMLRFVPGSLQNMWFLGVLHISNFILYCERYNFAESRSFNH